jgi:hypothetical protein
LPLRGVETLPQEAVVARVVDDDRRPLAHQALDPFDRQAVRPLPFLEREPFAAVRQTSLTVDVVEAYVGRTGEPRDFVRERRLH